MDIELYLDILGIDSTSSHERGLSDMLAGRLPFGDCRLLRMDVGDGTENLMLSWGEPRIVFCSHMDTVPPYIPPTVETLPDGDVVFHGRGTCDAKGQFFAMYEACRSLAAQGKSDFGLLLLAGEETGSFGAKAFSAAGLPDPDWIIIGEPTDNCMASSAKGTKSFSVRISGQPCHSGYPEHGHSAVMDFIDMMERLRSTDFPTDPVMGDTTWNIGKLISDNPQNILSPELNFRIYFRTTAASDAFVCEYMDSLRSDTVEVTAHGGDTPGPFFTLPGFPSKPVAFGSDAPHLRARMGKILCGPGSILVAHKAEEQVRLSELEQARDNYIRFYNELNHIQP